MTVTSLYLQKPLAAHILTCEQFESLATCFIHEVARLEKWDFDGSLEQWGAGHPSWKITPGETPQPSKKLLAAFRRQLAAPL